MCGNFRNFSTENFAHYHGVKLQRGKQLLITLIISYIFAAIRTILIPSRKTFRLL